MRGEVPVPPPPPVPAPPAPAAPPAPPRTFRFLRASETPTAPLIWGQDEEQVRKAIGEALNARNVAFLLGAGCSSLWEDKQERGIPTMGPLAETFCSYPKAELDDDLNLIDPPKWALVDDDVAFLAGLGAKLKDTEYAKNLERLMERLFSLRFVFSRSDKPEHVDRKNKVEAVIAKIQEFLWGNCTDGAFAHGNSSALNLYEAFYRKLIMRDRSLPRPWVFTTNYDLFNERAMDRLGLPYANGFSGVVERRFNPATFRYALAEQLDLSNRKWSAVDGFVYLCKLHGSISWTEDDHGLFPIKETWPQESPSKVMIYPTPAKQNSSLGSP